jgi:hypothetical protein
VTARFSILVVLQRWFVIVFLLLVVGVLPRAASATGPVTILDLALGERFSVPACSGANGEYDHRDKGRTCAWDAGPSSVFPPICNIMPCAGLKEVWIKNGDFVIGCRLYAAVHNGTLDALAFVTKGLEDQERVMAILGEKFDAPTKFEKSVRQNQFGAQFLIYHAVWLKENVAVFFDGDNVDPKRGSVLIETRDELERVMKSLPQSRRKL